MVTRVNDPSIGDLTQRVAVLRPHSRSSTGSVRALRISQPSEHTCMRSKDASCRYWKPSSLLLRLTSCAAHPSQRPCRATSTALASDRKEGLHLL
eukprot:847830-Prymnesium_polylepis.1